MTVSSPCLRRTARSPAGAAEGQFTPNDRERPRSGGAVGSARHCNPYLSPRGRHTDPGKAVISSRAGRAIAK
jgi:hypothetical protein